MAPDQPTPSKPTSGSPKPATDPTTVREPDNTRPPSEPTPRHPEKPQTLADERGEDEDQPAEPVDAQTEGM